MKIPFRFPWIVAALGGLAAVVFAFSSMSAVAVEEKVADDVPRLVADQATFNWGKVFQGEEVEHTFKLTNTSRSPILIKKIKPECGCTVARQEIKDHSLKPGETLAVTLNVNTAELKGGPVKKAAEIVSDFHAGDTKLFMAGVVRELFKRIPEKPVLKVVRDDEVAKNASLTVSLESNLRGPVKIKEIKAKNNLVSVNLEQKVAGKKYSVLIRPRIGLDSETAVHSETLTMVAEAEGKVIDLTLPVSVQLAKRITVTPFKSVFFKKQETLALKNANAPLPKKVLEILSQGGPGHRFKITDVKVDKGAFNARLEEVSAGRRYRLTIELKRPDGKSRRRLVRDKIILKTDDPKVPEIKIPGMAKL